ncbi:fatty acyl-AMP ligase [bacterium]|nr:fatty acyl-AMP ligase [bacterium]
MPSVSSQWSTLIDVVEHQSCMSPNATAFIFLEDGQTETDRLTFANLSLRAKAVAAGLLCRGIRPGDRVMLLFPSGLGFIEAFLGCVFAGAIAVPVYPPRSHHDFPIVARILNDCAARALLSTSALLSLFGQQSSQIVLRERVRLVAIDDLTDDTSRSWTHPGIDSETIAFLQYTSGSTGHPKGVTISHKNIIANQEMIKRACNNDGNSTFVGWLPLYHDMGLIGNILQPLYLGSLSVLMSPQAFLRRPIRWLSAITQYRAHTSGGPNFCYDLCLRKINADDSVHLDLSSWKVAFNGAEPVRPATLQRFADRFSDFGFNKSSFYPCYGLAEGTLFVTGNRVGETYGTVCLSQQQLLSNRRSPPTSTADEISLVACGRPWLGLDLAILTNAVEHDVGEICINGPNVTAGYWGDTDYNSNAFVLIKEKRYLRTGDLGFVQDGQLVITGRLKDVLIIRGKTHYPQDIEDSAQSTSHYIRPGRQVAFSLPSFDDNSLVLLAECSDDMSPTLYESTCRHIRNAVAENHGVSLARIVLLRPHSLPTTTSGKLRRAESKAMYLEGRFVSTESNLYQS